MKAPPVILTSTFAVMSLLGLAGCGGEQASEHARSHGHSHGDEAQSFSGATYQEGKGITLLEETREILNIQTVEAQERELPREIRLLVRVFAAPRQAAMPGARHLAGKFLASGTLPGVRRPVAAREFVSALENGVRSGPDRQRAKGGTIGHRGRSRSDCRICPRRIRRCRRIRFSKPELPCRLGKRIWSCPRKL